MNSENFYLVPGHRRPAVLGALRALLHAELCGEAHGVYTLLVTVHLFRMRVGHFKNLVKFLKVSARVV